MQSVQRQFGRLRRKASEDDAQVSGSVKDYSDVEKAIAKIIDEAQVLRNAWHDMAVSQLGIIREYKSLYESMSDPKDGDEGRTPAVTPREQAERTATLLQAYTNLKDEIVTEIASIESQLLRPAMDAREMLRPVQKTIKKRDNKRVDLANAQDKVNRMYHKGSKSPKEEAQLVKAQEELSHLTEEFEIADSHLRETLPPLVQAAYKIMPPLLANHVMIQNRLWGICYTVLHEFCEANGLPSPPPHMDDIVSEWNQAFQPIFQEVENFSLVRKFATLHPKTGVDRPSPGRRLSSNSQISSRPRISSSHSMTSESAVTPNEYQSPSPGLRRIPSATPGAGSGGLSVPTDFTSATVLRGQRSPESTASQRSDYFGQAAVQAKKKPPPPPPKPKPKPAMKKDEYVVAIYGFAGQGAGDLSFNEGDRIKIIKKTDTDQDWWEGELYGSRGSFPANYCQPET